MGLAGETVVITITGSSKVAVAEANRATAAIKGVGVATAGAAATSQAASKKMIASGQAMAGFGKTWTRNVSLPLAGIGAISGKMAVDFEKAMRNVNSIAQLPEKQFAQLNKRVLDMAGPVAQAPKTLAEGLYDLVSSGFDAKESMTVLRASARAATAGLTTTEVSTKAVAAALNAYRRPAGDAKAVSDDLFQTVNLGVVTFDELASTIGMVLPAAATMGVGLKQVGAGISTLTKQGQSGSSAVVNMNAALTALIKPTKDMEGLFKKLGIENAESIVKTKGFQGALEYLIDATDGTKGAIADLFPNVRAMRAVFGLTGKNARQAAADLRGFQNDTGATAKVLAEQSKSLAFQWNQLKAEASKLAIEIGNKLIPVMRDVLGDVVDAVKWFTDLPAGVQKTALEIGGLVIVAGPLVRIIGGLVAGLGTVYGWLLRMGSGGSAAAAGQAALTASVERTNVALVQQRELLIANSSGTIVGTHPVGAAGKGGGFMSKMAGRAGAGLGIGLGGAAAGSMIGGDAGNLVSKVGMGAGIGMMFGPMGAAAGAGVGAIVADVELLFGAEKKLGPMQQKLADSSKEIVRWFKQQQEASKGLGAATGNVAGAHRRQEKTADRVKVAERQLANARQQFGPASKPAVHAEYELADARDDNRRAIDRLRNAERLKGAALQMYKAVTRSTIAEERHRIHLLQEQRDSISATFRKEREQGASQQRLAQIGRHGLKVLGELKDEQKRYATTLGDASAKAGTKWAKHMKALPTYLVAFGKEINAFAPKLTRLGDNPSPKKLAAAFEDMDRRMGGMMDRLGARTKKLKERNEEYERRTQLLPDSVVRSWGKIGTAMLQNAQKGEDRIDKVNKAQRRMRDGAARDLPKAAGAYKDFAREGSAALTELGGNFNSFLEAFKQKPVDFSLTSEGGGGKPTEKAGGGFIGGSDRRDHVHALLGSKEAVLNVHQQPEVQTGLAVAKQMGLARHGSLQELFGGVTTPNHFAGGGFASKVPRPVLQGPGPLVPAGQKGIDDSRDAGLEYLRKHSSPARVRKMLQFAKREAGKGYPYVYGGGHGQLGVGPYDCSGYVSAILGAGNFLGAPMSTQQGSGLNTLGQSGQGDWFTWGVRGSSGMNAHTMIAIKGIGGKMNYFESGSGHGAAKVGGWAGSFEFRHMPGFARGGFAGEPPPKAREQLAKYGAEATDPHSPHFVGWGFAGGGFAGDAGKRRRLVATGGKDKGSGATPWTKVGYTTYSGSGPGAGGGLQSGNGYAELGTATSDGAGTGVGHLAKLMGRSGELPFDFPLEVKIDSIGKVGTLTKQDRGYGDGNPFYAIDIHTGAFAAVGLTAHNKGDAHVRAADGSGGAGAKEETVPAVFAGARTKAIDFPEMPKTLHGVKRELGRRSAELRRYRKAARLAEEKGKTKTAQALQANVTKLEARVQQLHRQRALLRREAAKRKISKRLGRQLAKLTGFERQIEGKGRAFEVASATAEQLVDLEPLPADLPAEATDQQREDAEKAYVSQLTGYINTQERPAYQGVLERAADWRNTILAGEMKATAMEHGWEGGIRKTGREIDAINELTEKVHDEVREYRAKHPKEKALPDWLQKAVKEMHQQRARLPVLRFRDHELRNVLGQGRDVFWAGVKDPIKPPQPPLEGTGSFEETLQQVQGVHWPKQHELIEQLPVKRVAGQFGGVIWDTQRAIAELDLKIAGAAAGAGGGGGGGAGDELKQMREDLEAQRSRERTGAANLTAGNMAELTGFLREFKGQLPYVGAFATGGVVPGPMGRPGWAVVHGGEEILRAEQGGQPVIINLRGDLAGLVEAEAAGMVRVVDRRIGRDSRTLSFAPGG